MLEVSDLVGENSSSSSDIPVLTFINGKQEIILSPKTEEARGDQFETARPVELEKILEEPEIEVMEVTDSSVVPELSSTQNVLHETPMTSESPPTLTTQLTSGKTSVHRSSTFYEGSGGHIIDDNELPQQEIPPTKDSNSTDQVVTDGFKIHDLEKTLKTQGTEFATTSSFIEYSTTVGHTTGKSQNTTDDFEGSATAEDSSAQDASPLEGPQPSASPAYTTSSLLYKTSTPSQTASLTSSITVGKSLSSVSQQEDSSERVPSDTKPEPDDVERTEIPPSAKERQTAESAVLSIISREPGVTTATIKSFFIQESEQTLTAKVRLQPEAHDQHVTASTVTTPSSTISISMTDMEKETETKSEFTAADHKTAAPISEDHTSEMFFPATLSPSSTGKVLSSSYLETHAESSSQSAATEGFFSSLQTTPPGEDFNGFYRPWIVEAAPPPRGVISTTQQPGADHEHTVDLPGIVSQCGFKV